MAEPTITCGIGGTLEGQWDVTLVALSCIVAIGGSFAALDCADRMRAATDSKSRRRYFFGGATLMGISVWTMHFVGMLAHQLGIPVRFDATLSVVSVAAAGFGAAMAFLIVSRRVVTAFHVATGGVAMGLAIASMHYLGMASMRIPATIRYEPTLFSASILIAIGASMVALGLARRPILRGRIRHWVKSGSALVMGFAIAGMHYVGMAAARYEVTGTATEGEGALVGGWSLQNVLVAGGVVILTALLAMASKSAAERQLALESLDEKRKEAIDALKAKDAFLASLSHELRTPLNPALLVATDCANNPEFSPEVRDAFAMVSRHIVLEARLIDDLLDVTRISRGALKTEPRVVDAHGIVEDAARIVRADLVAKKLELVLQLEAKRTWTSADPDRLQQVFWNLLLNAAKFTEAGGRVVVRTSNDGDAIVVRVTDTGIGMTESEVGRCFEKFVQGDHTLGGLGLGLSISRSIIELHGGTIAASSAGRGQGATFAVTLATVDGPPPDAEESRAAKVLAANGVRLSVLLVEDHEASRFALERLLVRRGHHVVPAASVADALDAAQRRSFDVVVSDIGLPDGDGYDLMKKLRAQHNLAGIAITGYGMEEDLQRAMEAGFSAHVTKPVTVRRLEDALAGVVGDRPADSAAS
jgi:signal transduction histidine kinase/ActR/RegA family two-component response regulator